MENNKIIKLKKLNKYILIEPHIGEGTFGKVYRCFEKDKYDKIYACKCLNIDFYMSNSIFIQKLKQELKVTKSLDHENLVNLTDLKRTKHNLYLILDYINGDNLEIFIEKYFNKFQKSPSLSLIKHLTIEIISGLNYLGKKKIIHRDIKLENIMFHFKPLSFNDFESDYTITNLVEDDKKDFSININELYLEKSEYHSKDKENTSMIQSKNYSKMLKMTDMERKYRTNSSWSSWRDIESLIINSNCKIIDFGLGKDLKECGGIATSICGSPVTMAPEIWKNKLEGSNKSGYDYKVDIWSTGCILFNLFTGSPPFPGDEIEKICYSVMKNGKYFLPFRNIDGSNNEITVEFIDLIDKLLQFSSKSRIDWDGIISHPFLNIPLLKQLKFNDLAFHLSDEEDSQILSRLKKSKDDYSGIVLNINESLNLVDVAKKKNLFIYEEVVDKSLQLRISLENSISDYIKVDEENKRERSLSGEIDKLLETYDNIEDFYFVFVEDEDGYILIDKVDRKKSTDSK